MRFRIPRAMLLMGIAVHAVAATVFAQNQPTLPPDEGGSMRWAYAAGIIVVMSIPAFINAKRSHLS